MRALQFVFLYFVQARLVAGGGGGGVQSRAPLPVREAALADWRPAEGGRQAVPLSPAGEAEADDPLSHGDRPSANTEGDGFICPPHSEE